MRYYELDAARGIAVFMMIIFHFLYDLNFFGIYSLNVSDGFLRYFGYATAFLFVFIAGVSVTLSYAHVSGFMSEKEILLKFFRRGIFIFALGMLITVVTFFYLMGEGFVVFGILHLIGLSVILSPLFFRFRVFNVIFGLLFIFIGFILSGVSGPDLLLVFGVHSSSFYSVDYTPLFPWFGVFLVGTGFGYFLYPNGKRYFEFPSVYESYLRHFSLAGRHSLLIYLVHQPLIVGFLMFVFGL